MARRYVVMFDSLKEQPSNNSGENMSELLQGIASLTKTVQQTLNSYEVRKLGDKVQGYVMNYTETEQKVREATNEDPWGPTGPQMQEISSYTFQYDLFSEVMGMLWKRMFQENKLAWRRVYKALVLLNYLLKNGSERVIGAARDHLFELRSLESYKCVDERGKDEGLNIRHRVKLIIELLNDEELLRAERKKAKTEGKEKYQGYSKNDMLGGRSSGSSRIDSFEQWNEKRNSKSSEFSSGGQSGTTPKREVTAFDFDTTDHSRSHANGSPELGIRERTPEPADDHFDDDEFGDFTSARAKSNETVQSPPVAANIKTLNKIEIQNHLPHQSKPNSTAETDLFDLFNGPTSLVSADHSPKPSNQNASGASAKGGDSLLDDFFGTAHQPQPTNADAYQSSVIPGDLLSSTALAPANNFIGGDTPHIDQRKTDLLVGLDLQKQTQKPVLPQTWADLKGKVNIDFDNLSLKPSPSKPTPSLNELKMQTSSKPNSAGDYLF